MKTVDFYFDFGSPATYLAFTQLPRIVSETGATINWKPMLLGGVFKATGNASPITVPAKGKYTFMDFTRHAKRYGVPFVYNPHFPINTITLMRGAVALQLHQPEKFDAYVTAMFDSMWVHPANMNDPATVGAELAKAGFDAMQLLALTQQDEVKNRLKELTDEAVTRGVFGAPTMFVGDAMFFGQDRVEWVKEALG
jgi:2-hydroxychromene-2-carboxylate isomerase